MKYSEALWAILKEIDDIEDPNFEFLAGCLSFCLTKNGLTQKQSKVVDKYITKYDYLWETDKSQPNTIILERGSNAIN